MNLGACKTKAIKIINEHSVNGAVNSNTINADYLLRMNDLADSSQKEIALVKKINAAFTVTQNLIPNLLGQDKAYDMVQHFDEDISYVYAGAKSYYFEVDRPCTVYIEEEIASVWTVLEIITVTGITSFEAHKGLIEASDVTNDVRIRFSGSYPYLIRNRALYGYTFASADDVPVYSLWLKYDLPDDYLNLKQIVNEFDRQQNLSLSDYKTEGRRSVLFRSSVKGSYRVEYYKDPVTIDSNSADDVEFEVDTAAQELIPYYLAAHMLFDESPGRGTLLLNMYQTKLANLPTNDDIHTNQTQNRMGW